METNWCNNKNSIVDRINKGEDFNPALTQCIKAECDRGIMVNASLCKVGNERIRV
jgi:hypothetical protein